jgi:hypothetical protein
MDLPSNSTASYPRRATSSNPRCARGRVKFITLEEKAEARRQRNQHYYAKVKARSSRNEKLEANIEESISESLLPQV